MIPTAVILQSAGMRASIWSLVLHAGLFAKGILLLLFGVSIWCWAVIGNRLRLYSRVEKADRRFLESFRKLAPAADCRLLCDQHPESLVAKVALAGQRTLDQLSPTPRWRPRPATIRRAMPWSAAPATRPLRSSATSGSWPPPGASRPSSGCP